MILVDITIKNSRPIIDSVSLKEHGNRLFTFVGANGLGKSNILRAINLFFNQEVEPGQRFSPLIDLAQGSTRSQGRIAVPAGDQNGFLDVRGVFTTIDVPGSSLTYAYGINNSGSIVGHYDTSPSHPSGFLYSGGGFSAINFPSSLNAYAYGINSSGKIVGMYRDVATLAHGSLLDGEAFTTIDVPSASQTLAYGINSSGNIVGTYNDAAGV